MNNLPTRAIILLKLIILKAREILAFASVNKLKKEGLFLLVHYAQPQSSVGKT